VSASVAGKAWPLLKGLLTWVPLLYDPRRGSTGGTDAARYCYSVWLRHFRRLQESGLRGPIGCVAELGPGDSLGIGLAAWLCGASRVVALDVVRYAESGGNLRVLEELRRLFDSGTPIPGAGEFPDVVPVLAGYAYPAGLAQYTGSSGELAARSASAREALLHPAQGSPIEYRVPWDSLPVNGGMPLDLVLSQAVLEHVVDLPRAYGRLGQWTNAGGWMSHVIDFRSHKIAPTWDGHRAYGDASWRIVVGRRPFLLNRESPARHLQLIQASGFEILQVDRQMQEPGLARADLAARFRDWSEADLRTASLHVIARRLP
jgi:hypothetical protein